MFRWLAATGPIAEDEMLGTLDDPSYQAKANVCKVLAEVGTRRSLEPLQKVQAGAQKSMYAGWRDVEESAREAIKSIEQRKR